MKTMWGAGIIIVLLILTMFSGCIRVGGPNCNNAYCMPPDVCCKGTCYHPCPANTAIDENCACVVLTTVPTPIPPTYIPPQVTNPAPGIPEGLLVWYDFEDDFTSTGFVSDRSGNNRDAEITGDISTSSGISGGRSIRFTGRGYIQAPDNPAALKKDVTFAFWFRTNDPDANYKMASAAWWNGGPGSGWTMATHVPEFWAEDTEGVLLPSQENKPNNFIPKQWNYEVVTYDGWYIKEYTNGNLINSWKSRRVPLGTGEPMAIGGWPDFGFNFIGELDDFRIYDHALQSSDISALYTEGLQ